MMKTHKIFKKSLLTQTIGIMLGTAIVLPAVAQEVDNTEVIQVWRSWQSISINGY